MQAVEVLPTLAFLDDGLEVFLHDDAVLHGVFDDGTDHAAGDVAGFEAAVAEVGGEGDAVGDDADGLGGAERGGGLLEFALAVGGLAVAEFAEDGDDAADVVECGGGGGEVEGLAELGDARWTMSTSSSMDSGTGRTTVLKRRFSAREFVDAFVAVVGGGDDVEALDGGSLR